MQTLDLEFPERICEVKVYNIFTIFWGCSHVYYGETKRMVDQFGVAAQRKGLQYDKPDKQVDDERTAQERSLLYRLGGSHTRCF